MADFSKIYDVGISKIQALPEGGYNAFNGLPEQEQAKVIDKWSPDFKNLDDSTRLDILGDIKHAAAPSLSTQANRFLSGMANEAIQQGTAGAFDRPEPITGIGQAGQLAGGFAGGIANVGTGALIGGTLGSVVPGIGTVIGASVGGIAGAGLGSFGRTLRSQSDQGQPLNYGQAAIEGGSAAALQALPGGGLVRGALRNSALMGLTNAASQYAGNGQVNPQEVLRNAAFGAGLHVAGHYIAGINKNDLPPSEAPRLTREQHQQSFYEQPGDPRYQQAYARQEQARQRALAEQPPLPPEPPPGLPPEPTQYQGRLVVRGDQRLQVQPQGFADQMRQQRNTAHVEQTAEANANVLIGKLWLKLNNKKDLEHLNNTAFKGANEMERQIAKLTLAKYTEKRSANFLDPAKEPAQGAVAQKPQPEQRKYLSYLGEFAPNREPLQGQVSQSVEPSNVPNDHPMAGSDHRQQEVPAQNTSNRQPELAGSVKKKQGPQPTKKITVESNAAKRERELTILRKKIQYWITGQFDPVHGLRSFGIKVQKIKTPKDARGLYYRAFLPGKGNIVFSHRDTMNSIGIKGKGDLVNHLAAAAYRQGGLSGSIESAISDMMANPHEYFYDGRGENIEALNDLQSAEGERQAKAYFDGESKMYEELTDAAHVIMGKAEKSFLTAKTEKELIDQLSEVASHEGYAFVGLEAQEKLDAVFEAAYKRIKDNERIHEGRIEETVRSEQAVHRKEQEKNSQLSGEHKLNGKSEEPAAPPPKKPLEGFATQNAVDANAKTWDEVKAFASPDSHGLGETLNGAIQGDRKVRVKYTAEIGGRSHEVAHLTKAGNTATTPTDFSPTHFATVKKIVDPKTGKIVYHENPNAINGKTEAKLGQKNQRTETLIKEGKAEVRTFVQVKGYNQRGYDRSYYLGKSPEGSMIESITKVDAGAAFKGKTPNIHIGPQEYNPADLENRGLDIGANGAIRTSEAKAILEASKALFEPTLLKQLSKPVQELLQSVNKNKRFTPEDVVKLKEHLSKSLKDLKLICGVYHL